MRVDEGEGQPLLLRIDGGGMRPKILQKLEVLHIQRMIFGGRTDLIAQAQRLGPGVARRTVPCPVAGALIAVGHGHGQGFERVPRFPFLEGTPSGPQDKEVRGVPLGGVSARPGAIPQWQAHRLIVVFEDRLIPLHRVDRPQLHMLAFKLDRALHFGTGIASSDVGGAPAHLAHRRGGPDGAEHLSRVLGKAEALAPGAEFIGGQHVGAPCMASSCWRPPDAD
jgi:hypothetical protein